MDLQIKHYGRVKNGKLIFDIPSLYDDQLRELEGNNIVMTIKKKHEKASLSQYGYYRGCILPICYEAEMFSSYDNKDEIHDVYFAPKFLSYKRLRPDDPSIEVTMIKSLADLSKEDMTKFIEKVIADCQINGIEIPPSEFAYNKYYTK